MVASRLAIAVPVVALVVIGATQGCTRDSSVIDPIVISPDPPTAREMLEKAVEYREQAYFDSALASLSEAMAQFYAKRDTSGIAWGVLEAARLASIRGRHPIAMDSLDRIAHLRRASNEEDSILLHARDIILARTLVRMGRPRQAIDSLAIYVGSESSPETHAVRGYALYELGASEAAIRELQTALTELKDDSRGGVILRSRITTNLALSWFNLERNFSKAKSYLEQTDRLRRSALRHDHPQMAEVAGNLGMLLAHAGLYDEAHNFLTRSARVFEAGGKDSELNLAVSYSNLGILNQDAGEYAVARAFLNRSLEIRNELFGDTHPRLYYTYSRLARVHLALDHVQTSIQYSRQALNAWRGYASRGSVRMARTFADIGDAYVRASIRDSASHYHNKALRWIERLGSPLDLALVHRRIANASLAFGDWFEAKRHLDAALHYVNSVDATHELLMVQILNDSAYASAMMGLASASESLITRAVAENVSRSATILLGRDFEYPLSLNEYLRSIVMRARLYIHECDDSIALPDCRVESLKSDLEVIAKLLLATRRQLKTIESKKFWAVLRQPIIDTLMPMVGRLVPRDSSGELTNSMFVLMEAIRAGVLVDQVHESGRVDSSNSGTSTKHALAELKHKILLGELQLQSRTTNNTPDTLLDRLRENRSAYDQLLRHLEQSSPTYYAIKYSDEIADATTVSESLGDNEALIEFYADEDSVYSIVLTSTEWQFSSTPARPVAQSVNQLVGSLTGQIFHDYVASASNLYHQLLKPAEAILASKDLIIVPHGILHHVPFETLLYTEPDLTTDSTSLSYSSLSYLVKRHAISYSYSATLRQIMRRRTSNPADRQFLGIAPVQYTSDQKFEGVFTSSVRSLPGAELEVTRIHNLFSPAYRPLLRLLNNSSTVSLGENASEAAIQGLELSRYKYIHFATHGIVNDTIPELSGLVMHPSSDDADDILHLGEIYGLELNADLVVLSACETGRGKIVVGNGVVGLTGGFLFAGARNVVVSLWQVDDVTAGELMRPFYVRFLRRNEYRRALRSSKLEMIASESKYARPYYWAPFVLFDS